MVNSNNPEFHKRALNQTFMENFFISGIHKDILDEVKKDDELIMCLRGEYVTVYYKSLQILKLHDTGRTEINKKYGIEPKNYKHDNTFDAHKYFAEAKKKLSNYQPKGNRKQNKREKEVQQLIVNKYNSEGCEPNLSILDIEYRQRAPLGKRFDAIAAYEDETNQLKLVFVEIKYGSGAVSGNSGVDDHFDSTCEFAKYLIKDQKYQDAFYEDMEEIIEQLNVLGLWKNKFNSDKKHFIRKPELIFMFVNYTSRKDDLISSMVKQQSTLDKISEINLSYDKDHHILSVKKYSKKSLPRVI